MRPLLAQAALALALVGLLVLLDYDWAAAALTVGAGLAILHNEHERHGRSLRRVPRA